MLIECFNKKMAIFLSKAVILDQYSKMPMHLEW